MASHKKSAHNGPAEKFWYGDCAACGKETKKITAHVLQKRTRKVPTCTVCRGFFPPDTLFTKK